MGLSRVKPFPFVGSDTNKKVRETSLIAFRELRNGGQRHYLILKAIKQAPYPPTDRELAQQLGFSDPNSVRPRRRELVRMQLVKQAGKRPCTVSGRLAMTWRLSDEALTTQPLLSLTVT